MLARLCIVYHNIVSTGVEDNVLIDELDMALDIYLNMEYGLEIIALFTDLKCLDHLETKHVLVEKNCVATFDGFVGHSSFKKKR